MLYFIVSFILIYLFFEYIFAHLIKKLHVFHLKKKTKGYLVLSYDDGPGIRLQQQILNILSEHAVKATFFLNAERAESFPVGLETLVKSGNEVALHCYKHLHAWRVSPYSCICDMLKGQRILGEKLTNPNLLRFPYGKMTLSSYLFFRMRGTKIAWWTHDSGDTYSELPLVASIIQRVEKDKGGVVLMHSFDHDTNPSREKYVTDLTQKLISQAKNNHWKIITFSEL